MGGGSRKLGMDVGVETERRSGEVKLASRVEANFLWWRQQMGSG